MMYSYHSFPELEESILELELEPEPIPPTQIREFICYKDTRYLFYLLFVVMVIFFLIFIVIIISRIK